MSLHLDMRQRAMLQEMGVHLWLPHPAQAVHSPQDSAAPAHAPADASTSAPQSLRPAAPPAPTSASAPRPTATPRSAPEAAPPPTADRAPGPAPWALQAPQLLYPGADPQQTPADLGSGWLIVVEGQPGADPLAGEAGRLLDNMLRALRLHRHPRVFVCTLAPLAADAPPAAPCADVLAGAVATVQPALVLVMGRSAARAVLGRSEPLGRLRAETHAVAGVPAVVTYDAPYLLRAPPGTKPAAWADLCRARALAADGAAQTGTAPAAPPAGA